MSKASMSEVSAGRRGPASWDRLLWLVRALLSYDDGEEVKPPEGRDPQLQVWRDRWHSLESERAAARRASSTEDTGRVNTAGRDPAATSSRLEGVEPDDRPWPFGRRQRLSPLDALAALPDPASTTAADDNAAVVSPEAAPPSQMLIPTQQLQAPSQPNTALTAPQLPRFTPADGDPLPGDCGEVSAVAFLPGGRYLAIVSGNVIRLCDPISRVSVGLLTDSEETKFLAVAFSSDGSLLAAGDSDGTLHLRNVAKGSRKGPIRERIEKIWSVAFSPDDRILATGSAGGRVRLWDAAGRALSVDLNGHTGDVYSVAFSPNGRLLATAGEDGTVHLWAQLAEKVVSSAFNSDPLKHPLTDMAQVTAVLNDLRSFVHEREQAGASATDTMVLVGASTVLWLESLQEGVSFPMRAILDLALKKSLADERTVMPTSMRVGRFKKD
jgi:hypothetical protein